MVKFVKLCSGGVVLVFVFASIFFFFLIVRMSILPKAMVLLRFLR